MLGLLCLSAITLKLHTKYKIKHRSRYKTKPKVFEENTGENLCNFELKTLKYDINYTTHKNIINLTLKFRTFALWKTLKRDKTFRPGENICKYHIRQMTCIQNYKNISPLNSKEMPQFLKWAKNVKTHFTKEDIEMANERCLTLV